MLHLLRARRWLKLFGHELAQRRQRSPPLLVRESLPKLVQIQSSGTTRWDRRRPPFCDPCMTVLLERRDRMRCTSRPASKKRKWILPDMPSRVETGSPGWQGDCHFCISFKHFKIVQVVASVFKPVQVVASVFKPFRGGGGCPENVKRRNDFFIEDVLPR